MDPPARHPPRLVCPLQLIGYSRGVRARRQLSQLGRGVQGRGSAVPRPESKEDRRGDKGPAAHAQRGVVEQERAKSCCSGVEKAVQGMSSSQKNRGSVSLVVSLGAWLVSQNGGLSCLPSAAPPPATAMRANAVARAARRRRGARPGSVRQSSVGGLGANAGSSGGRDLEGLPGREAGADALPPCSPVSRRDARWHCGAGGGQGIGKRRVVPRSGIGSASAPAPLPAPEQAHAPASGHRHPPGRGLTPTWFRNSTSMATSSPTTSLKEGRELWDGVGGGVEWGDVCVCVCVWGGGGPGTGPSWLPAGPPPAAPSLWVLRPAALGQAAVGGRHIVVPCRPQTAIHHAAADLRASARARGRGAGSARSLARGRAWQASAAGRRLQLPDAPCALPPPPHPHS